LASDRIKGGDDRQRRRWTFAGCVFHEANWTLVVDGNRVPIETKPLELLRELLLHAGNLVSKDRLMDRVWPDVEVVEASLPTAIRKLRRALRDDRRDRPIIETVPRIGYRLTVPVEVEELAETSPGAATAPKRASAGNRRRATDVPGSRRRLALVGGLAIAGAAVASGLAAYWPGPPEKTAFTNRDVFVALREMDVDRIDEMIVAGWDPNASLDTDSNSALNILLGVCEWDPGHDKRRMLLLARTLIDGNQRLTDRNAWGDTPYSIAKASRYCGVNHPVTVMIRKMCQGGVEPRPERCLADYKRDAAGKVMRQKPQAAK
jgi:DNA-binding winged helix-turn-helix (wHTH) protein